MRHNIHIIYSYYEEPIDFVLTHACTINFHMFCLCLWSHFLKPLQQRYASRGFLVQSCSILALCIHDLNGTIYSC